MSGVKGRSGRTVGDTCGLSDMELLKMYRRLGTLAAVAKELKVSDSTVWRWFKVRDLSRGTRGGSNNPWGRWGKKGKVGA